MAYIAVLNSLRKMSKLKKMKKAIEDLVCVCKITSTNLDVIAFNTYLAALCDKAFLSRGKLRANSDNILSEPLAILQKGVAKNQFAVKDGPDTFSFNTVLNAAASCKNHTVINELIDLMESQGVSPDIYTYNARLKALKSLKMNNLSIAKSIIIIDEILSSPNIKPDAYTIELSMVTLSREGRIRDALGLLANFSPRDKSDQAVSNAYVTFLIALVKGGEVKVARLILETFILPQPKKLNLIDDSASISNEDIRGTHIECIVRPKPVTRHFNSIIEGYCKERRKNPYIEKHGSISENANLLFENMISAGVLPDAYTITMMMGLQNSAIEITNLWKRVIGLNIKMTVPIFNSMITAYGRVNDPSSACYLFNYMMERDSLRRSRNSWNVFLSALSKASIKVPDEIIQCVTSDAARVDHKFYSQNLLPGNRTFYDVFDGLNSIEVAKSIFDLMKSASRVDSEFNFIPLPDAQSYCLLASTLSHGEGNMKRVMDVYNDAVERGIIVDGRTINAIIRCYEDNIDDAIAIWKCDLRQRAMAFDKLKYSSSRSQNKQKANTNLIIAYHGLFHVCGKSGRSDIALKLVYAMNKDGIEPTETALNCYNAGSRSQKISRKSSRKIKNIMMKQYESLLAIECTKYDRNDKRRTADKRVRIII